MKHRALLLLFSAALALATPARAADVLLLAFTGFDYQDPNPNTDPDPGVGYLAVGEGYKVVGFVTSFGPDLEPWTDPIIYEYTIHTFDLTVASRAYFGGFLSVSFNNGGRGRYFRDAFASGTYTHGTYGINPPNATSPSTFTDGPASAMRLGGSIDNFVLNYNFNTNQGNFSGTMNLDEGPDLIYVPVHNGWTLAGLAGRPNATVPTGYDNQLSGECRIPDVTPTTHTTWGAVKALYR